MRLPAAGGSTEPPPSLHLTGPIRVDADVVRPEAWVVDGRLTFDRPRAVVAGAAGVLGAAPTGDPLRLDGWVLPGMVDAHCHVGLDAHGAVDRATTEAQALTDRDSGALLLRDAGSAADTRWVDDRADLPVLLRAGRHIARPKRYLRNYGVEIEPDQLAAEVRRQAARGDGWVKLVGDWIDRDRGDLTPCWPADVLREAIAAGHEAGARVTAHCFAADSLPDLLAAGIDGIEHGCGFGPDTLAVAAEAGVAVVPTLINIDTFPDIAARGAERFPTWARHLLDLHARRGETVRALYESGVPLYVGTDAGGTLPHGQVAAEVARLVEVGVPPAAAVGAATWAGRSWLGRPGLHEGAQADLVVLDADPLREPAALTAPRAVVLRGRVVAGRRVVAH